MKQTREEKCILSETGKTIFKSRQVTNTGTGTIDKKTDIQTGKMYRQ